MNKYLFILTGLLCIGQTNAQVLNIGPGTQVVTSGNPYMVVRGGPTDIVANSTIKIATGTLTLNSTLSGSGRFSSTAANQLVILYTNAHGNIGTINFAPGNNTLKNLTVNLTGTNDPSLTLGNTVTVSDSLILPNGFINLGSSDLIIGSAATISGGSTSSFVVTNGSGRLINQNIGTGSKTGSVVFPVGANANSYTPLLLSNAGTADDFSVNVLDNAYSTYTNNTPSSTAITSNVVGRTWIIDEATAGGSNATINLQWNLAEERSGFNRNSCYLSHYNNTTNQWEPGVASAASGTGPFMQTINNVTRFSPFGVGSTGSPLPADLISFSGKLSGEDGYLQWTTANEQNIRHYVLERSVTGADFKTITITKPLASEALQKQYQYRDANVVALNVGHVFYRLKIEENNGSYKYSSVITLKSNCADQPVAMIVPNPVSGNILSLNTVGSVNGNVTMKVLDLMGRVQLSAIISENDFQRGKISIDASMLTDAFYMLQLENDYWKQSLKFSKQ